MSAEEATFKTLIGIIDDHNSIKLKTITMPGESELLFIDVSDGGPGASFFFDNPHEARTFLTRALHQVGLYIEESTPAEDLKAEIYGFLKSSAGPDEALDLLNRATDLLGG